MIRNIIPKVEVNPYDQVSKLREVILASQTVLLQYIVPDGISQDEALKELIKLHDNPEVVKLLDDTHSFLNRPQLDLFY